MTYPYLGNITIDTTIHNSGGTRWTIALGAFAASTERLYIPAYDANLKWARMLPFDFDGNKKLDEVFQLPLTPGTIYGGATFYNGQIWVVTDEQREDSYVGCIRRFTLQGEAAPGIGLPWMYGTPKDFQPLGITLKNNLIYVVTRRTGWFQGTKLNNDVRVERYDAQGNYEGSHKLDISNARPAGLVNDGTDFYDVDVNDRTLEGYDNDFGQTIKTYHLNSANLHPRGVAYNGASIGVLDIAASESKVFFYGQKIKPDPGTHPITPITPSGDGTHKGSTVTRRYRQYERAQGFTKNYDVIRLHQNDVDYDEIVSNQVMYIESTVRHLDAYEAHNRLFESLAFQTFVPKYTQPGLQVDDLIVPVFEGANLPTERFRILGFIEAGNGRAQMIQTERIG